MALSPGRFTTHHNALDMDMYLRVAPELNLKRLTVGGFERVYEINRNFRNEGVSTQHNPEFTMLELYRAYADYEDLIVMVEALLKGMAQAIAGSEQLVYQGESYDFSKPFERMTVEDVILKFNADFDAGKLTGSRLPNCVCRIQARHQGREELGRRQAADRDFREDG